MKTIIDMKDLSDSREVMMKKSPPAISIFIYILFSIVVIALLWANFSKIDNYINVTGEVRPNDSVATITSMTGGKVKKINFADGNNVTAGDSIIEFDSDSIMEQKKLLESQLESEESKLKYYDKLKRSVEAKENLFSCSPDEETYYYQYENYITALNNQINQINTSNKQAESKKKELKNSIETINSQLTISNSLINDYKNLYNSVLANNEYTGKSTQMSLLYSEYKNNYHKLELVYDNCKKTYDEIINQNEDNGDSHFNNDDVTTIESTSANQEVIDKAKYALDVAENDLITAKNSFLLEINSNIEELKSKLLTLESQKKAYSTQLNTLSYDNSVSDLEEKAKAEIFVSINNSIDIVNSEIENIKNQLITINQSTENAVVLAQSTGTLLLLHEIITGDYIQAGAQIGTIVPDGSQYKVSLYIPEGRISEIKVGQEIEYTVNAISVTEYGKVKGKILSVSVDSFTSEDGTQKFYKAEATLDTAILKNKHGDSAEIKTGMLLEARIISGSQSVLSWLLDKLNFKE